MSFTQILTALIALSIFEETSDPQNSTYREQCDAGVAWYMEKNFSPKTSLVYTCPPDECQKSDGCTNGMFHWYQGCPDGYGKGISDCALINGTVLAGMTDKWMATDKGRLLSVDERKRLKDDVERVARGMLNLAKLHGIKGFVARGICPDDGRTICSQSSIDQVTHWEHSLWRYASSGMADRRLLNEYREIAVEIAEFMERMTVPENNYNFGLANGTVPDTMGICYMWGPHLRPHEAARLSMLYCSTYLATGDSHWSDMYEKYIDESLDRTLELKQLSDEQIRGKMPCYSLYQAMCSLEVILSYEKSRMIRKDRINKVEEAMAEFSRLARERVMEYGNTGKPPYGMCWDGELLLTELMDVNFRFSEADREFFRQSMEREDLISAGWCRAAHIYAAYWRSCCQTLK